MVVDARPLPVPIVPTPNVPVPVVPIPNVSAAAATTADEPVIGYVPWVDRRFARTPPAVGRPADLTGTVASIVDELRPMFGGVLAAAAITDCATRAVHDLLGSICLQALPEMAVRLATVRLETVLRQIDRVVVKPPPVGASRVDCTD